MRGLLILLLALAGLYMYSKSKAAAAEEPEEPEAPPEEVIEPTTENGDVTTNTLPPHIGAIQYPAYTGQVRTGEEIVQQTKSVAEQILLLGPIMPEDIAAAAPNVMTGQVSLAEARQALASVANPSNAGVVGRALGYAPIPTTEERQAMTEIESLAWRMAVSEEQATMLAQMKPVERIRYRTEHNI